MLGDLEDIRGNIGLRPSTVAVDIRVGCCVIPRPCISLSAASRVAIDEIGDEYRGARSDSSTETCEFILRKEC
jgi:hypothetical protein